MGLINKIKKGIIGTSLMAIPFAGFSQDEDYGDCFFEDEPKMGANASLGGTTNFGSMDGSKIGIYVGDQRLRVGYVIEMTNISNERTPNVEFLSAGFEAHYYLNKNSAFRPYIGTGVKFGTTNYYTEGPQKYQKGNGIGTDVKAGFEIYPAREFVEKLRFFGEVNHGQYYNQKSASYPENSQIKHNKSSVTLGVRF